MENIFLMRTKVAQKWYKKQPFFWDTFWDTLLAFFNVFFVFLRPQTNLKKDIKKPRKPHIHALYRGSFFGEPSGIRPPGTVVKSPSKEHLFADIYGVLMRFYSFYRILFSKWNTKTASAAFCRCCFCFCDYNNHLISQADGLQYINLYLLQYSYLP